MYLLNSKMGRLNKFQLFVLCSNILICYCAAEISNDIENSISGNLPKPVQYFTYPTTDEQPVTSEKTQEARFTYPNSGNLETYGSNILTHPFYPFKFDLGGLLVGAFVGFGALLLVPKIMHLLVPELAPYGPAYGPPYARNDDTMPQGIAYVLSQFDKVLAESNVNSSECLQKAICAYVQSSQSKNQRSHSAANSNIIDNTLGNYVVNFLIDGSKFKSAVENGKQDIECSILYPKCPFNQNSVVSGIKQLILQNNIPEQK